MFFFLINIENALLMKGRDFILSILEHTSPKPQEKLVQLFHIIVTCLFCCSGVCALVHFNIVVINREKLIKLKNKRKAKGRKKKRASKSPKEGSKAAVFDII